MYEHLWFEFDLSVFLRHFRKAFTRQRPAGHRQTSDSIMLVFIGFLSKCSSLARQRLLLVSEKLFRHLIHANHGSVRIIGQLVDLQHLAPGRQKRRWISVESRSGFLRCRATTRSCSAYAFRYCCWSINITRHYRVAQGRFPACFNLTSRAHMSPNRSDPGSSFVMTINTWPLNVAGVILPKSSDSPPRTWEITEARIVRRQTS